MQSAIITMKYDDFKESLLTLIKAGQPLITNAYVEWVQSKCTKDLQKGCTKLLSLPDNAKKELNFYSLSQNITFHSLRGSFLILTTSSTQVKTLHMDLCWD